MDPTHGRPAVPCGRMDGAMSKLPLHPGHPERICWGCARYCSATDMACGNGTERGQHPIEIFGPDWIDHELDAETADAPVALRPVGER
jgi:hypothetical protein